MQKRTDFFDNSLSSIVPDEPLATRNKPHNNQLCADLSRLNSAYPVVSHFLRFAWQTTPTPLKTKNDLQAHLQVIFLFTLYITMLVRTFLSYLPELLSVLFGYRFIMQPHLYKRYRIKNAGKKHYAYTDKNE